MKEHKREDWRTCRNCAHRNVCREVALDSKLDCDHHIYDADPNRYGDITEILHPVFEWLRVQYPNDAKMIVDDTSASLYIECKSFFDNSIMNLAENIMKKENGSDGDESSQKADNG